MRGELSPPSPTPTDLEPHRGVLIIRRQGAAFPKLFHVTEHLLEALLAGSEVRHFQA